MLMMDKIKFKFFMDVFADENNNNNNVDVMALIQSARKEEKDKLYTEIEGLKNKVKLAEQDAADKAAKIVELNTNISTLQSKLTDSDKTHKEQLEALQKEVEELKTNKNKQGNEEVEKLQGLVNDLNSKIDKLQQDSEEKEKLLKLEVFKQEKIREAGDAIVPDIITGNTEEEILASIENSKKVFAKIAAKFGNTQMNTVPSVIDDNFFKDKSPEEIARMSPKEYAEYRKTIGIGQKRR